MKKLVSITMRGKCSTWAPSMYMSQAQIDAMREDGFVIDEIVNTVPEWVFHAGLMRPWVFVQDLWNFRRPF